MKQSSYSGPKTEQKLSSYSGPRAEQKLSSRSTRKPHRSLPIRILRFLCFIVIPYLVINTGIFFLATTKPAFHVVVGQPGSDNLVPITFTIDSRMPVKSISIEMDDMPLKMEQIDEHSYRGTVNRNGAIEISMENFNGMTVSTIEYVDSLDDQPPTIEEYSVENNILVFTVVDTQSAINFDSIYATAADGTVVHPLYIDRENSHVSFQMRSDGLTIYVADVLGNESITTLNLN